MAGYEKTAVYGGTFSPPHLGHIRAAKAFANAVMPDKLIIIPSAVPPHKSVEGEVSARARFEMARLAFKKEDFPCELEISDMEQKSGQCYTVDTLRLLRRPGRRLFILIGADMLLSFEEWREYREIFALAEIYAAGREKAGAAKNEIKAKARFFEKSFGADIHVIDYEPFEVSSSEIRRLIKNGGDFKALVPPEVAGYIEREGLYKF